MRHTPVRQLLLALLVGCRPLATAFLGLLESPFDCLLGGSGRLLTAVASGGGLGRGAAGLPRWFFWHGEASESERKEGDPVMIPPTFLPTTTSIASPRIRALRSRGAAFHPSMADETDTGRCRFAGRDQTARPAAADSPQGPAPANPVGPGLNNRTRPSLPAA